MYTPEKSRRGLPLLLEGNLPYRRTRRQSGAQIDATKTTFACKHLVVVDVLKLLFGLEEFPTVLPVAALVTSCRPLPTVDSGIDSYSQMAVHWRRNVGTSGRNSSVALKRTD